MDHKRTFSKRKVGLALQVNRPSFSPMLEITCACGFIAELQGDSIDYVTEVSMPGIGRKQPKVRPSYRVDFLLDDKMIVELKGCPAPAPRAK